MAMPVAWCSFSSTATPSKQSKAEAMAMRRGEGSRSASTENNSATKEPWQTPTASPSCAQVRRAADPAKIERPIPRADGQQPQHSGKAAGRDCPDARAQDQHRS